MKKKFLVLGTLFAIASFVLLFVLQPWGLQPKLVSPKSEVNGQQIEATPSPTPAPPKTFKFDSSTDLKKELDNINPQVLDSDFE